MTPEYPTFMTESPATATGYIVESDPFVIFSNLLTIFIKGNARPVSLGEVSQKTHEFWRRAIRTEPVEDFLYAGIDNLARAEFPDKMQNSALWLESYQALMSDLSRRFTDVDDFREDMTLRLTTGMMKDASLDRIFVMQPSLGYARDWLGLPNRDLGNGRGSQALSLLEKSWMVQGLGTATHNPYVEGLIAVDRARWSANLIARFTADTKIEGRAPTERPAGEMLRQRELLTSLTKLYFLYEVQDALHWMRHHHEWFTMWAEVVRRSPVIQDEVLKRLDIELAAREALMAIPVHDLIHAAVSGLPTTQAVGHFGQKKAIHVFPLSDLELEELTVRFTASKLPEGIDGKSLFIEHLMRPQRPISWIGFCKEKGWVSYSEMLSALRDATVFGDIKLTAGLLQWGEIKVDTDVIDYYGADFAFSDGKFCSKRPGHVAYGFSPILGLNNRKAYGYSVEYEQEFNTAVQNDNDGTGGRQEWSVITVPGYLEVLTPERLERNNLPFSASMGEADAEPRFLRNLNDDVASALQKWFEERSQSGYLLEWYPAVVRSAPRDPSTNVSTNPNFWQRSWDAESWAAPTAQAPEKMQRLYLKEFGSAVTPADNMQIAYSKEGFYMRMPVRASRTKRLIYMTPTGKLLACCNQRGYVRKSGTASLTIALPHDLADLDRVVDMQKGIWQLPTIGGISNPQAFTIPQVIIGSAPMGVVISKG